MGCISSRTPVVGYHDGTLRVDWSPSGSMSDLTPLLGNTRTVTSLARSRRLLLTAPLTTLDISEVNADDTIEMLPKSRRALTIQEIAALARSSLHGISQVVKDHVTKPTAMAQGRIAHLVEWKGWCKPTDAPAAESDLNSYSDLTEGEQEARFAAGVAEQFAIAEAKLRAWSSVDGDDSNDDSYDEDFLPANEPATQSTDVPSYPPYLKDLIHSQVCQHLGLQQPRRGACCRGGGGGEGGGGGGASGEPASPTEAETAAGSPDTLCSGSLCSLDGEQHPLLANLSDLHARHGAELALAKILSALQGGEELLLARLQGRGGGGRGTTTQGGGGGGNRPCCGSPSYSVSYSETYLSPGEDEDEDDAPCKDLYEGVMCPAGGVCRVEEEEEEEGGVGGRRVSDVASSGVVSLDEEDFREEEEEEERERQRQRERAREPSNQ